MDAPHHLLVGYDGQTASEMALHRAFRVVSESQFALVHVVCVVQATDDWVRLPQGTSMHRYPALEMLRHTVRTHFLDWNLSRPNLQAVAHIVDGDPAHSLVDFAYKNHVDQIVIGVGNGGLGNCHVGSVAERVLGLSDIPVHLETPLSSQPPRSNRESQSGAIALRDQLHLLPGFAAWKKPAEA